MMCRPRHVLTGKEEARGEKSATPRCILDRRTFFADRFILIILSITFLCEAILASGSCVYCAIIVGLFSPLNILVFPATEYGSDPYMPALQNESIGVWKRVSKTFKLTGGARLASEAVVCRCTRNVGDDRGITLVLLTLEENETTGRGLVLRPVLLGRMYGTGERSTCGIRPVSEALVGRRSLGREVPYTRSTTLCTFWRRGSPTAYMISSFGSFWKAVRAHLQEALFARLELEIQLSPLGKRP